MLSLNSQRTFTFFIKTGIVGWSLRPQCPSYNWWTPLSHVVGGRSGMLISKTKAGSALFFKPGLIAVREFYSEILELGSV